MTAPAAIPPEEKALRDELARSRSACIRAAETTSATAARVTRALEETTTKRTVDRRVRHHSQATCTESCCAPEKEKTS